MTRGRRLGDRHRDRKATHPVSVEGRRHGHCFEADAHSHINLHSRRGLPMKSSFTATVSALAVAALLTVGVPSRANAVQTGALVKVVILIAYNDGSVAAQFTANVCNDTGAAMNWGQWMNTEGTADGRKAMMATLSAAKLSNRNVLVRTEGKIWGCRITAVELH
jgi:hypothetical protein